MMELRSEGRYRWIPRVALVCVCLVSSLAAPAQNPSAQNHDDADRQHAFELYKQGKMVDAMPLLEKLAAEHPKDIAVHEGWGVSVMDYAQTLTDLELRKKARLRARTILLEAKALGDNSNLLQTLLGMLPEDGSPSTFSERKEVDEAMQQAEADFARGDLDKAREGYLRAILLDPNLYSAALFTGDAFYKQNQPGFAGEWFARAVQIDPNRETAYRYWGDALMSLGKMDEARGKFVEAVIAEPYNRTSWMGISQWADQNHVQLNFLQLQNGSVVKADGGQTTITLDSTMLDKKDQTLTSAWITYGANRALWQKEKFKKKFPNETTYRHTLLEEADSLHVMVSVASELSLKAERTALDASLVALTKIDQAGLLEPFVLINRADQGIGQDYPAYREVNRDKIRRYLDEWVVPKTPEHPVQ